MNKLTVANKRYEGVIHSVKLVDNMLEDMQSHERELQLALSALNPRMADHAISYAEILGQLTAVRDWIKNLENLPQLQGK